MISWENFGIWLLETHKPKTTKELYRYAQRFAFILENPSMASQLSVLNKRFKNHPKNTQPFCVWRVTELRQELHVKAY